MKTVKGEALSLRFKPVDVRRIVKAATHAGMLRTKWIIEVALARAERVLENGSIEFRSNPIEYTTAGGYGRSVSLIIPISDFSRIKRAAAKERALPSPWIRAAVLSQLHVDLDALDEE